MSEEKLSQFRSVIFFDVSLQKKLREMTDREEFVRTIVELGNERGFDFTAGEVENALHAGRRVWIERWLG
ncbi:MAG TPA: Nif11-like leader peptide family natural product precursor [Pyrinomonadaceae bacterium]|jgi:predicted ribosomally synthesized peptide with nif11-like leader